MRPCPLGVPSPNVAGLACRFRCKRTDHVSNASGQITCQRHPCGTRCYTASKGRMAMSEQTHAFSTSFASDAVYKTGLRSFMEYRDLGIEAATNGQYRAHVIR